MFLFGSNGSSGQGEPAGDLHQEIVDRDEEIAELKAKIEAYRDALEKEPHFDHFEMAMEEKNKVLEEQFAKVEELTKANQTLLERLQNSGPEEVNEGPESGSPEMEEKRQAEVAHAQATTELRLQLEAAHQELEELRASADVEESAKARTENLELRARLAHAIYCTTEAQKALATQNGNQLPNEEAFSLTMDTPGHVGAMFGPRESRELGRGWQVVRVREGTWAERAGVLAGDELHHVDGHPIEVLPEAEVMELLQKRPVELTWIRRQAAPERTGEATEQVSVPEAPRQELDVALHQKLQDAEEQNRALEDQLKRLSLELGKVQSGDVERQKQQDVTALENEVSEMRELIEDMEVQRVSLQEASAKLQQQVEYLTSEAAEVPDLRNKIAALEAKLKLAEQSQASSDGAQDSEAKIQELTEKIAVMQSEYAAAEERQQFLEAKAKDEAETLKSQVEQLQSELTMGQHVRAADGAEAEAEFEQLQLELARERDAHAADVSKAAEATEQFHATIQQLQETISSEADVHATQVKDAATRIQELSDKVASLQEENAVALERAVALEAHSKGEVEQLRSELTAEQARRESEASQAAAAMTELHATIKQLQESGPARDPAGSGGSDGWGDLDFAVGAAAPSGTAATPVDVLNTAVAEDEGSGDGWANDLDLGLQGDAGGTMGDEADTFKSQLEQLQSELAAERDGRAADVSKAAEAAELFNATIRQLQETIASEADAHAMQEKDAAARIQELSDNVDSLTSKLEQLHCELAAEQQGRESEASKAASEMAELNATIKQLQDRESEPARAPADSGGSDGWGDLDFDVGTAALSGTAAKPVDALNTAVAEDEGSGDGWANDLDLGDGGVTVAVGDEAETLKSQLEQLQSELSTERDGRAADVSKAAEAVEQLNATIKQLQETISNEADDRATQEKDAAARIQELGNNVDSLASKLEQMHSQLVAEQQGRESEASKAAADIAELNATIQQLQDAESHKEAVPARAPAASEGSDGWGDLDFDVGTAAPPGTAAKSVDILNQATAEDEGSGDGWANDPDLGDAGVTVAVGDDAATLKTQLEQLQSELVTERGGRAVDASKAAEAVEQLNATIKQLQETISSEADARATQEQDAAARIQELSDKVASLQEENAAALERAIALEANSKGEVESVPAGAPAGSGGSDGWGDLDFDVGTGTLPSTAAKSADVLNTAVAEDEGSGDGWANDLLDLGDGGITVAVGDEAATLKSQLEQLQSELATERDGRAADVSKAEEAAEQLNATIKQLQATISSEADARSTHEKDAAARIQELKDKVVSVQEEHAVALERAIALEANGKGEVDSLTSKLEQLQSELAAEQQLRESEASKAAADMAQLNATIKQLREAESLKESAPARAPAASEGSDGWGDFDIDMGTAAPSGTAARSGDVLDTALAEDEGSGDGWANDLDLGDGGLAVAVGDEAATLKSQLEQLQSELATERDGRAADLSKAAQAAAQFNATIKQLEETISSEADSHATQEKDAAAKIQELSDKVVSLQEEHTVALERATALEANGKGEVDSVTSKLERLQSELAAEQQRRESEASKAAADMAQLNATIKQLQEAEGPKEAAPARAPAASEGSDGWGDFDIDMGTAEPSGTAAKPADVLETAPPEDEGSADGWANDLDLGDGGITVAVEDEAATLKSQLEQLQSELATERDGRAADVSKAAEAAEQLNAKIQQLQETISREADAHATQEKDAAARIQELSDKVASLQEEHSVAVERAVALEAKSKREVDSLTSKLEKLHSELAATEQKGCESESSKAAVDMVELHTTVKELQDSASVPARAPPGSAGADGWGDFDFDNGTSAPSDTAAKSADVHNTAVAEAEGSDGWGDFDFDNGTSAPSGTAAKSADVHNTAVAEAEGSDGWGDFDFDNGTSAPSGTAAKSAAVLNTAVAEDEGSGSGDGWANDLDLGDGGITMGDTGGPQVFDMAVDDDVTQEATLNGEDKATIDALQARITELESQLILAKDASGREAPNDVKEHAADMSSAQPAVSMFSTATRLFGTASSVAAAFGAAAESTFAQNEEMPPKEMPPKEMPPKEAGVDVTEGDPAGEAARRRLESELEVMKARLTMAQDQLKAERAANSQSATQALFNEVVAISEVLVRERLEFEREKALLSELLRQAREDAHFAGPDEASGAHAKQLAELRRQRDQARGIAQRIARQVSSLAEQLSTVQRGEQVSIASVPEPEQTLLQMDAVEGDEVSAPRPPVEITSGWDVFNPDDQLEHTIPTGRTEPAAQGQDGWGDFDFDDLM